jgi:hypothetical protein
MEIEKELFIAISLMTGLKCSSVFRDNFSVTIVVMFRDMVGDKYRNISRDMDRDIYRDRDISSDIVRDRDSSSDIDIFRDKNRDRRDASDTRSRTAGEQKKKISPNLV